MDTVVSVSQLSKSFGAFRAVDDLSFEVGRGVVYGFLGQNGAGKSTTIRMLLTLIAPTGGSIRLFGRDVHRHRRQVLAQVGAVIEKPDLYNYLSAYDNLRFMARLSGVHLGRAELLQQLARVGLESRAQSKVKTFSQGMKQRLGIACAMVHGPSLIVLDEPTNGLDPQGIADMRNLILHLSKEEGKTLIISSHLLAEMELIADAMLIIDQGKKVVEGKVTQLLNPSHTRVEVSTSDDRAAKALLQASQWQRQLLGEEGVVLEMHRRDIGSLTRYLVQQGVDIQGITPRHSLENYFLSLTSAPYVATDTN